MTLRLRPCFENPSPTSPADRFVFLDGDTSDAGIKKFIFAINSYGGSTYTMPGDLKGTIRYLADYKEDRVIGGGLAAFKDDFELYPQCCCGLEDWREWFEVKRGGHSPWLGHSPDPWVEVKENNAVIHSGLGSSVVVNFEEVKVALRRAEKDLIDVLQRVREVTSLEDPDAAHRLCKRVATWFDIRVS